MATGIVGESDTDILSDEIFDVLCSMCKNKGKNTEGVKFCVECDDYFCVKCVGIHNQVPSCARHKLLDKAHVKSGTSKCSLRAPAVRCDRHGHKHIDMYCQNHDKVGCSTCMVVDHRSCVDIFYIPAFLKTNIRKAVAKETLNILKIISNNLIEQTDNCKQDKQNLQTRKAELLADIRKFRQEINDQLDEMEKNSVAMIEEKLNIIEGKIDGCLKQLQENKEKVSSALNAITSPNINQTEEFVYVKMGEEVAKNAELCIEENKTGTNFEIIQFDPNRTLVTQLEKTNILGKIPSVIQIKGGKSYCVKIKSDNRKCHIMSACYMEDDTIILADRKNNKLKRLDCNNYTVRDYCDLPESPWQVCSIDNNIVAVSLQSKGVHLISLDRQMKTINKINTDFYCYGLAYANNNLYISDSKTSVYIYTLSGRILKQFTKDQSGVSLFSDTCSLAVSKDASRIYVADGDHGLVVLDNNGQVVSRYSGEKLKGAYYCHFTEAGTVLVAGFISNNIVQFTSNDDLIEEVVPAEGGMGRVWSVCCNQQMSEMFVSRADKDDIQVYDITPV